MHKFGSYLRAQFKRSVRHYPVILFFTILLASGIVLLLTTLFQADATGEKQTKVRIGLVGDLNNSYLELGMSLLQNFDSSQYYLEMVVTDRDGAVELLQKRDIIGYLEIPSDFMDAMLSGNESSLRYVTLGGPAVLGPLLVEEVAVTVSEMVSEAQNGLYGFLRYADRSNIDRATRTELADAMGVGFATQIFTRDRTYEVEVIGQGNNLSFKAYYVCAFCMMMILLMGTVCVNLLTKSDLSLNCLLTFRRFGAMRQVVAEYLPFLTIIMFNLLLFFSIAGLSVSVFGADLDFLHTLDSFADFLRVGILMLPAALLLSVLQFLLCELTTGVVNSVLLQILAAVALAFASGYLLPLNSLPPVLASLSLYLPTGLAFRYAASLLTDTIALDTLAAVLAYAAVILAAAVAVRNMKIRSGRV
jgi:hypothetical protein